MLFAAIIERAAVVEADESSSAGDDSELLNITESFFRDHCIRCHGPDETKGELRLDSLDADFSKPATFERWQKILERVQAGEMPPQDEPRPKPDLIAGFENLLTVRLNAAAAERRGSGRVVLRRLNRIEYENTLNDFFNVNASINELKQLFLADPEQIARCITEKLITYATGQPVGFDDRQAVNKILTEAKASDYGLRTLVHALVASELFRSK